VADRSVASKVIGELEGAGAVATLKFTEGKLGAPTARKVYVAPIVTAEDRANKTSERIYREAEGAKVAVVRKRAEDARERRGAPGESRNTDEAEPCSRQGANYDSVVDAASTTGRVVDGSQVRSGQGVNTVYQSKNTKEKEEGESGVVDAASTTHANSNRSAASSSSPRTSELIAEFVPSDACAHPTVSPAILSPVDDPPNHAPDLVSESDFQAFHRLADTFGRPADAMVMAPSSRELTDPILLGLARNHLGSVDRKMGKLALNATFLAAHAAEINSRQHGHAGRGGGGIRALVAYFDKVLPAKVAHIQAAEAERMRNEQVDLVVEQAIAEKRLKAARQGRGPRRGGRASWDDIGAEVFGSEPQED